MAFEWRGVFNIDWEGVEVKVDTWCCLGKTCSQGSHTSNPDVLPEDAPRAMTHLHVRRSSVANPRRVSLGILDTAFQIPGTRLNV